MNDHLSTLMLDVDDLSAVIADVGLDEFMDELISVLRSEIGGFDAALVEHQIRSGFNYDAPEHGLVEWMPTMVAGDVVSVKTVGYHPANPQSRGVPSVLATTALYDTTTGSLTTMCEATLLTALRTGAASALMTDALVPVGPVTLGVVGCGAQAVTQIHAIGRLRPINSIIATDVDAAVAATLEARLPAGIPAPEIVDASEFNSRVGDLSVVCTCTSVPIGDDPVVDLSLRRSDLHVNAVGADFPGKTELSLEAIRAGVVLPDVIDQCLIEGEAQRLDRRELGPSMVDVLSGDAPTLTDVFTVFDSTGWSFEDLLAARLFRSHAVRLGLGTTVALQRTPTDPFDPYETLRPSGGRSTSGLRSTGSLALVRDHG